jgi:1,4-alpha-glucan branching enzyme
MRSNDWIYRHLHRGRRAHGRHWRSKYKKSEGIQRRVLNQAARELLLAQASDWAFIMKTGNTVVSYAIMRTKDHLLRFNDLAEMLGDGKIDEAKLKLLEQKDNLFPRIDYRVYA